MITPDDRTPEERRADLRAEVEAEIEAMTDEQMVDLLKDAIAVLVSSGADRMAKAIMKAAKRIEELENDCGR